MNLISTDILNIVLGVSFILFCILMVFQIKSEIDSARKDIVKAYGFANVVNSAQVFERTGVDMLGDIDYFDFENKHNISKSEKRQTTASVVDEKNLDI